MKKAIEHLYRFDMSFQVRVLLQFEIAADRLKPPMLWGPGKMNSGGFR